jgi:DNA repair exonuclease SbcCD nuclease subunit
MSKYAVITDTHFGVRSDSSHFEMLFREFFERQFFPYLLENNIKHIFHLGDVFDRRKYINFKTLAASEDYFFKPLIDHGITMTVIPGNHDVFFKNTNSLNSLSLLLPKYQNIQILHEPTILSLGHSERVLMVPWITDDNREACLAAIKKKKTAFCFGHFEIEGFEMYRGIPCEHGGLRQTLFKHYAVTASGHFHHRSSNNNIYYLGSPYEMTWADYEDPRGFHVFDSDNGDLEFIENTHTMFRKVVYDDVAGEIPDPSIYENKSIKLIVVEKKNTAQYEGFLEALYNHPPADVQILEDYSDILSEDGEDSEVTPPEDTMTLLDVCVDTTITSLDKARIKRLMKTLFIEAQNRDTGIDDE